MRIAGFVRALLGIFAMFIGILALRPIVNPQFVYAHDNTSIQITYSDLWTTECVDVKWATQGIESIFLAGSGTVGEGETTVCGDGNGPGITINTQDHQQLDYNRDMLRHAVQTALWLSALSFAIVFLWPWPRSFVIVASAMLLGLLVWVVQGQPNLELPILMLDKISPLAQPLLLAAIVPVLYWWAAPPERRVEFLLALSILTLLLSGVALSYLLFLGVLTMWITQLSRRSSDQPNTKPLSSFFLGLCALSFIGFTIAVLAQTTFRLDPALYPRELIPLIYGLCAAALLIGLWQVTRFHQLRTLIRHLSYIVLIVLIAQGYRVAESLGRIPEIIPFPTAMLMIAALILTMLIFVVGSRLTQTQRRFFINGGILLLIIIFSTLKLNSLIGWFGFSYIAFRLLHVLLEMRQNASLPDVSMRQMGLYTLFFSAQAVGPIQLLPPFAQQMQTEQTFSANDYGEGWERILWGALKKFFIADVLLASLLPIIDAAPSTTIPAKVPLAYLTPFAAWVQLYAYAFYLYCDFSGFIDIAIGLARLVGYRLPENFDRPYTKASLAQFWQSWHMTLSHWARTYIYLPLSRTLLRTRLKRSTLLIVLIANLATMGVIGLWHGVTVNYIAWGLWHAVGLFVHKAFSDRTRRRQIQWRGTWRATAFHLFSLFLTFHVVALSWVFFMFPDFKDSLAFFAKLARIS